MALVEIQKFAPGGPKLLFHSMSGRGRETSKGLIQHSSVNALPAPTLRLADEPTNTKSLTPSKRKACPTSPGPKAIPLRKEPRFGPAESSALSSPRHQLTKPEPREANRNSYCLPACVGSVR